LTGVAVFRLLFHASVLVGLLSGCSSPADEMDPAELGGEEQVPIRILSLGDSYTIGESVDSTERWPVQLADSLRQRGIAAAEPVIVARTGWTTDELAAGIRQANLQGSFDLVTLLIGVNNQYRGRQVSEYHEQFHSLLRQAIELAGDRPQRVLVVSIPDWGVMPFAQGLDREKIGAEIDMFNNVNRQETLAAGARYIDITPVSRRVAREPELAATDGLHPSGKMYASWIELILPQALAALGGNYPDG
jgi:lysophospholipase L1-like esterase